MAEQVLVEGQELNCELFEGVCHLRQENGYCPLHAQLQKMQDQLAWLEEAGYVDKEMLEASKDACGT